MSPVNILLVDDQDGKLLTYEAMLSPLGETLLKARSAREALAHLLREDIAVVLMDVNMPELDGFELASMIREHPRCRRTAIIFVSAVHLTDVDRMRGYEIGAVDYVSVPVVPEILRAKVCVFIDLYRKTTELEFLNRTLEERVSKRTAELEDSIARLRASESRLRMQSEALAEQDRRKNEFLAMLAHELRNPLQPICMALELTPDVPLAALGGARKILDRQVRQLVRLVDDLLDASRITSGKLELRRKVVELAPLITAAVDSARPLAEQKQQLLSVTIPASPIHLDCDDVRLTQVFHNLLINAIKYTPTSGHIDLTATLAGAEVTVVVADDGTGVAPDDATRIFEMFYQGGNEPRGTQAGLGLGLALVKRLVELHGGSVLVASDGAGQGSEFRVRLPVVEPAAASAAAPAACEAPPDVMQKRIVVIDDNRDVADTLVALLRAAGAEATAKYDGAEAIDSLTEHQPQVILLDLGMPHPNGYDVARAIRSDPRGQDIILVALTGWGGADVRRRTIEAGFDTHLVKPVGPRDLLSVLTSGARGMM